MKKQTYLTGLIVIATMVICTSCKKEFLSRPPLGALSQDVLATPSGLNGLLIGAYAALDGIDLGATQPWSGSVTNWIWGSVAGGDAHKGSDATDQAPINPIATGAITPSNPMAADKWVVTYGGIDRVNAVFKVLPLVKGMSADALKNIEAQAHFLRAHYYFELKRFYNMVPWISDSTKDFKQPNNLDIWPKIEADFKFAFDNLPETQSEAGRANKWAAGAYLAKTYLYQKKFPEAKTLFDQVISQGMTSKGVKYDLLASIEDNFRPEKELTSPENVFSVEMAANVGTGSIDNATNGEMLNYPYGDSPFGCCGFFQPTIDLANSYRTDANGLPYLDTYNEHAVKNDMGVLSTAAFTPDDGNLDPRIDWTIGRRGIPYLDWGLHPGRKWIRDQDFSGPYAPKKNIWWHATEQFHDNNSWAPATAINYYIIRFADLLLMAAEAHAQTNDLDGALTLVNRVRTRAANKAGWVYKYKDNANPAAGFSTEPAANYIIKNYLSFVSKDQALKAIYFERKLELGMEGVRFFDLSRWGIAAQVMNDFYAYEGSLIGDVKGGHFTAGKNEYFPIPQTEIDKTTIAGKRTLTQNKGYQ
jgi:starch-binding outer membrane protein, SusD/RagB family